MNYIYGGGENEEEARWTSALKSLVTSWRTWCTLPAREMKIAYFPLCDAVNVFKEAL